MKRTKTAVRLTLDRDQVMIMLSALEGPMGSNLMLNSRNRSRETLREMVERAGRLEADDEASFFILKMAPIYSELLKVGGDDGVEIGVGWVPSTDSELADAEQEALAALN